MTGTTARARIVCLLLTLLLTAPLTARAEESLAARIDALLDASAFRHASVGVFAVSLRDGRTLYVRNPDTSLIPASNLKLITASAALARLGPNYRFRTWVFRTGVLDKKGVLHGDLILRGSGDPSLSTARLSVMARAVRDAGIRQITGRLLVDDSRFPGPPLGEGWQWDDEPFAYQPQISALNCDGNVIGVRVAPAAESGLPVVASLLPATRSLTLQNQAATTEKGTSDAIAVTRKRGRNVFVVAGSLPVGAALTTYYRTVDDPAVFTGERFQELLNQANVGLKTAALTHGKTPVGAALVVENLSAPLTILMRAFLKDSDNLYGEALLRALGAEIGAEGTANAGAQVVHAFLRAETLDESALTIADGSGLSRLNTVTPRLLVTLLLWLAQRAAPTVREGVRNALPVAGVDGTLRGRLRGTFAAGNLRGKTGTLGGVSALSGTLFTRAGEPVIVSILMNHYRDGYGSVEAKRAQDAIILALIEAIPSADSGAARPPADTAGFAPVR